MDRDITARIEEVTHSNEYRIEQLAKQGVHFKTQISWPITLMEAIARQLGVLDEATLKYQEDIQACLDEAEPQIPGALARQKLIGSNGASADLRRHLGGN